jgi:hypothetical protein
LISRYKTKLESGLGGFLPENGEEPETGEGIIETGHKGVL